ncbi:hypothetical protein Tco_1454289, partial [Tanacetum coccineum]
QPEPELRKSKRNKTPKNFGPEFQLYLIEGTRDGVFDQQFYCFNVEDDPKKFNEAMKSHDVAFWKEAINDEMDSITDETIEKFKARLVIQGFRQKSEIDYFDTYAPVDLTKEFLSSRFSMKDMGKADVLKKFNYFECTPISTLVDTSKKLMPNNGHVVSQIVFSRVIGCLMYAMTCTRPDIAFVVGKLSRLTYTGYPLVLEGYTDTSWISNTKYNSFTSGWVFLLGGGAISWASKKQTCITGSIMKSESVALAAASKEAEWLKNLLFEILLWSKPIAPISICCVLIMNGLVSIEFVMSQQNLVDHLTKGLARDLVIKSAEGMGLNSN